MSKIEIKPCPFCGGTDVELLVSFNEYRQSYYKRVRCKGCYAQAGAFRSRVDDEYSDNIAVERWNKRT